MSYCVISQGLCHTFYPPADSELTAQIRSYLLRSGRRHRPLRSTPLRGDPPSVFDHARFEPFTDQANDPLIGDPMFEKP
jgi:hypothetical protein